MGTLTKNPSRLFTCLKNRNINTMKLCCYGPFQPFRKKFRKKNFKNALIQKAIAEKIARKSERQEKKRICSISLTVSLDE